MMRDRLYFVRDLATGRIKIGTSWTPTLRLRRIRQIHPRAVLMFDVEGGRRLEDRVHTLLIDHHLGGEWFESCPAVETFVFAVAAGEFDFASLPDDKNPIRVASARKAWAKRRQMMAA